ncbi:MAG: peptidylprolyl isomerase [Verrucomicrobiales bacterium]|nr:peptidylprolyl isomerase [Verrucomicrobiales bacterium]
MKKLPWRSAFYLVVLLYLFIDLKCCNGPLKRKIAETRPSSAITIEKARARNWVALVNQEPVTKNQLQLSVARHLYQRGIDPESVPDITLKRIRRASLRGLIDDILIRQYASGVKHEAPEAERQAFIAAWEKQFQSPADLKDRTELQGLTEEERQQLLGDIWSVKSWLEKRISPGVGVTDEEVNAWFDNNKGKGKFDEPEKVRARQIFISTVEEDTEIQEGLIRAAKERIDNGEAFADVARALSQDERTKDRGGDLNWFSTKRLPAEFTDIVFQQKVGEAGEPFKTKIGWHLVEVTDQQAARPPKFEEVTDEIRTHILNQQKVDKVNELLGKLRKVAHIMVFTENLD